MARTPTEHPDERRIRMLHDQFKRDLDRLVNYTEMMGRPLFAVKLSEAEELALYIDPGERVKLLEQKAKKFGWTSMDRYKKSMDMKLKRYQDEMNKALGV